MIGLVWLSRCSRKGGRGVGLRLVSGGVTGVCSFLTGIGDIPDTSKVRRAFRRQCCLGGGAAARRGARGAVARARPSSVCEARESLPALYLGCTAAGRVSRALPQCRWSWSLRPWPYVSLSWLGRFPVTVVRQSGTPRPAPCPGVVCRAPTQSGMSWACCPHSPLRARCECHTQGREGSCGSSC